MEPRSEGTLDAVARLAGGIAHDLNNALLPLRAYGEIALKKIARGEDASAEVEEMLAAAERGSTLIRELLAFSGRNVPGVEVVGLTELVSELEPDGAERGEDADTIVLLVEDDPAVRRSIERMLAADGYGVVSAASGEEAVSLAASRPVDLVLTDVAMPGLNGRETAERIADAQPGVPVVFMSGYTDDAVLRRGVGDRTAAFLEKPFGADDLARALACALGAR